MGHVVSKQDWGTIDIDTDTGVILVREDWLYIWHEEPGQKPFTLAEKRAFHRVVDRQVWGLWSGKWRFHVLGDVPFAKKFAGRTLTANFDVRWTLTKGDWTVIVTKVPPNTRIAGAHRAEVQFNNKLILLMSVNTVEYTAPDGQGGERKIKALPHEFGHTMDNLDEYKPTSGFHGDIESIMNVGRQIRERHLFTLLLALNNMIPGVQFTF